MLSRYPRNPGTTTGLSWTGENFGTITPTIVLGAAVFVSFDNFSGDNLVIGEGIYPNLGEGKVDVSTTLTKITLPSLLGPAGWNFKNITGQSSLTVIGPSAQNMLVYACEYTTVNFAYSELVGTITFQNCTPNAPLLCTMPSQMTGFVMDNCGYSSIPTLPAGLTNLTVTGCANVTELPAFPGSLLNLSLTGTPITSLPSLPAGLVSLGIEGTSITELSDQTALTSLQNLEAPGLGFDVADLPDLSTLPLLTVDLSSNALSDWPALPASVTSFDVHGNGSMPTPDALPLNLTTLFANDCGLSEAASDAALALLVANGKENGSVDISGTNSAPSAAGLVNKAILEGRGWTVTVTE